MIKNVLCLAMAIAGGVGSAFAVPTTLARHLKSAAVKPATGKTTFSADDLTDSAVVPAGSTVTLSSADGVESNPALLSRVPGVLGVTTVAGNANDWTGDWGIDIYSGKLQTDSVVLDTQRRTPVLFFGVRTSSQNTLGNIQTNSGGDSNLPAVNLNAVSPLSFLSIKDQSVPGATPVSRVTAVSGVTSVSRVTLVSGVTSVAGVTSVPDGGATLTLLGIGFISLTASRRRLAL